MTPEDDARAVAPDEGVGGTTEPSPPEMLYVLYGQNLGPNVSLKDLDRAQRGLRAVVASSLRVSGMPISNVLIKDIFAPLVDPLEPIPTVGSLEVKAAVYGNPWWEVVQIAGTVAATVAGLKLADQLINLAMKIVTFPADFHARRAKLRAEAAKSEHEELRALVEKAELGLEVRHSFGEGRDLGAELRRRAEAAVNEVVAEGVAASTLVSAVADMPVSADVERPVLKLMSEDEALEEAVAARELAASQDLRPKALSAGDQNLEISSNQQPDGLQANEDS